MVLALLEENELVYHDQTPPTVPFPQCTVQPTVLDRL